MPVVRYFLFVGGVLLAVLFWADGYFPPPSASLPVSNTEIDRSIIRIHSGHKWPDAIRMDTRAPMPPADPVMAEAAPPSALTVPVRQAYAFEPTPPQRAPEKLHRRARPPRAFSREHGQRFAIYPPRQRFANYQPPDSRGWPPAGW